MRDAVTLVIDGTSRMVLDALADALVREPQVPDLDLHVGRHLEEIARHHDDWSREVDAWRHVLGLQLVNRALDARVAGQHARASEPTPSTK